MRLATVHVYLERMVEGDVKIERKTYSEIADITRDENDGTIVLMRKKSDSKRTEPVVVLNPRWFAYLEIEWREVPDGDGGDDG